MNKNISLFTDSINNIQLPLKHATGGMDNSMNIGINNSMNNGMDAGMDNSMNTKKTGIDWGNPMLWGVIALIIFMLIGGYLYFNWDDDEDEDEVNNDDDTTGSVANCKWVNSTKNAVICDIDGNNVKYKGS